MDKRNIAIGAGVALITVLFLLYPSLQGTGFFSLGTEPVEQDQSKPQNLEQEEDKPGINTSLSLEIIEPTTLEASLLTDLEIQQCPSEEEAEILVKNTGNSVAEKMFLSFAPGIKVNACSNCSLDKLKPGQEVRVTARLCLEEPEFNTVQVGSANSNAVELRFE